MPKKVFLYMSSASHNAYRNMAANAPEGFEIAQSEFMAHGVFQASRGLPAALRTSVKNLVSDFQPLLSPFYNHAHILLNSPKVRGFRSRKFDLVHSGQSLLDSNLPYVVDFEHAAVFSGYSQYALRRPGFVRALERVLLDSKLKKLLAWSDAAANSLTNVVRDEDVARKVETLYPVMVSAKRVARSSSSFNFLFIGNNFYAKGGYESLLAFEKIAGRYDCRFTAIGDIPAEVYARFGNNGKITLSQRVPYQKVVELYSNSDVFVFPTHYDTYGFVIPEALSFGLPVIGVDSFSTPELVEHEKTGLLIKTHFSSFAGDFGYAAPTQAELGKVRLEACRNPPQWYVSLLSEAMERLMTDSRLREACSSNAIREATEGKFSPKRSREQLRRVYEDALAA
ncbi:MAG: glycosyltransferase family 4 protein [Beijerinckiaceae bacterium]